MSWFRKNKTPRYETVSVFVSCMQIRNIVFGYTTTTQGLEDQ